MVERIQPRNGRELSRRQLLALAGGGTMAGVAGCFGDGGEPAGDAAEQITIGLHSDITREFWELYGGVSPYWTRVLEPLLWVGPDFDVEPWLAVDWERTDTLTWEFTLREDVQFHNGEELVADHVVHSIEKLIEQFPQARFSWRFADLDKEPVRALDDRTVEFKTREEFAGFAAGIAHNMVAVQHPETDGSEFNAVGTGPYELVDVEREQNARVAAFEEYWGGAPATPELTYRVIVDPTTRSLAMEDELDVGFQPPKSQVASLRRNDAIEVREQLSSRVALVNFNLERGPTDDADLRRALNHAVSQETIIDSILEGLGKPARGPIGSIVDYSAYDSLPPYEQDFESARELVDRSSYDGETLKLEISNEAQADWVPEQSKLIAEIIKVNADRIGVDLDIRVSEYAAFSDAWRAKDGHMYMFLWGTKSGSSDYIFFRYHSRENTHFSLGEEFDSTVTRGERAENNEERFEAFIDAQQMMMEQAAVLPMYEHVYLMAVDRSVEGLDPHPLSEFVEMKDLRMER
jgi:peptide/nickel transport system substrate-binding protein